MSLIYGDNFTQQTTLSSAYTFVNLFKTTNIVDAANLVLPATTLTNHCYYSMFSQCTSLTQAPELPATTLAKNCYSYMFQGCTSLTSAPALPATTLASSCYQAMFSGCTSLTTAPVLSATTLATSCYSSMFVNCTNLTQAPALPATTLVNGCYNYMFRNCTNLNSVKALFTTTPTTAYTQNWLAGVSSTGTFYKNPSATWDQSITPGVSTVPANWTITPAS